MKRSTFLQSAGTCLALPFLESLDGAEKTYEKKRRFVGISSPYGVYRPALFPEKPGKDYEFNEVNQSLKPHKDKITFFSNLDHGITGGHQGVHALFSGVKLKDANANPLLYPEKNISLDQKFADYVGYQTRFHSLSLCPSGNKPSGLLNTVTWTKNGIAVPRIEDVSVLFDKLFKQESQSVLENKKHKAEIRFSILDAVLDQSKKMNQKLGQVDRQKMDQYFTSIRELEQKIQTQKKWYEKPKPKVEEMKLHSEFQHKQFSVFFELINLAFTTDSTRSVVFHVPANFDLKIFGIDRGYHGCSHHGKNEGAVEDLKTIDGFVMSEISKFIGKLEESNILDDTTVVYGAGMSDGSSHSNVNLPMIVAGGGFNHGQHRVYSNDPSKKTLLCNLYLTILQSLGVPVEKFSNSTGTLSDFHLA